MRKQKHEQSFSSVVLDHDSFLRGVRNPNSFLSAKAALIKMMYLAILTNYPTPLLPQFGTCVVVGNGPSKDLGSRIDSADAVFRINDAPVDG